MDSASCVRFHQFRSTPHRLEPGAGRRIELPPPLPPNQAPKKELRFASKQAPRSLPWIPDAPRGDLGNSPTYPDAFIMAIPLIIAGARTPIGSFRGGLKALSAPDLGAIVIRETIARAGIAPNLVEEVIMGNVLSAGLGQAPARQAALKGGLPPTIPAVTINKVCGSGLKAVMLAAQAIRAGDAQVVVAGGMESMSRAPHIASGLRDGQKFGDIALHDAMVLDGLTCAFEGCHMGMHAEHIARTYGVTRDDQDQFAAESQRRASQAVAAGAFHDEIVAVRTVVGKESISLEHDECPRGDTTIAKLAALRPAFDKQGTVTAGNASTLSDGAAAVAVVADDRMVDGFPQGNSPWRARVLAYHTSGTEPKDLFIAPAFAIQGALEKAGLNVSDIDQFEINEAFAAQMVACMRELKLDAKKVNPLGGGISLGHPIGASGCRVLVTLLANLHRTGGRHGVASLCLGGGNAVALVVKMETT